MFLILRTRVLTLMGAGLLMGLMLPVDAQPPEIDIAPEIEEKGDTTSDLPDSNPPSIPSPIEQRIKGALSGQSIDYSNSDPILDGMLEVLQQRGSILENSLLGQYDSDLLLTPQDLPRSQKSSSTRSEDAKLAELLLRSARLLEQRQAKIAITPKSLPTDEPINQGHLPILDLVESLRQQAAQLLIP